MRIGGIQIHSVKKRFFLLPAGIILLVLAYLTFLSPSSPPANPYAPAFPASHLSHRQLTANGDWIDPFIRQDGLNQLDAPGTLVDNYKTYLGQPFKVWVYVPTEEQAGGWRPDLLRRSQASGWTFFPTVLLDPTQSATSDQLEQEAQNQESQPLVIGVAPGQPRLTPGQTYEVTGMFWWHTATPFFQGTPEQQALQNQSSNNSDTQVSPSPIILSARIAQLSPTELSAPTTNILDLGLTYQEGPLRLTISRLEWASGNQEFRACVAVENTGSSQVPMWPGVTAIQASVAGGSSAPITGTPGGQNGQNSSLAQQNLNPGQVAADYVTFDGTDVSDPSNDLTLSMPALNPNASPGAANGSTGANDQLQVFINHNRQHPVTINDPTESCTSETGLQAAQSLEPLPQASQALASSSPAGFSSQNIVPSPSDSTGIPSGY